MFIDENASVRLLTVMECSWDAKNVLVRGRPFGAISLRIMGDAEITEGGKTEQLRSGDVLYMPKGASYRLNCGDEQIFVIHFDTDVPSDPHMSVFHFDNNAEIYSAFSELLSVWNNKTEGYYLKAKSLFYNIIYEIQKSARVKTGAEYERIRSSIEYLFENYTDPTLTVSALCKRAYMSDTYFRRNFIAVYGQTPIDFLNRMRASHAAVLLSETDSSVSEVARCSGFSDVKYFSTVFKKYHGVSPSEFKRCRNK